jgi:hypothetical protein
MAISGVRAIVGASLEDSGFPKNPDGFFLPALEDDSAINSGAAYILERDSATGVWSVVAFVKPRAVPSWAKFGLSVSLSGDFAIVGVPEDESNVSGIFMNPTGSETALSNVTVPGSGAAYILDAVFAQRGAEKRAQKRPGETFKRALSLRLFLFRGTKDT